MSRPKLKVRVGQWAGELAVSALEVEQEGGRRSLCCTRWDWWKENGTCSKWRGLGVS